MLQPREVTMKYNDLLLLKLLPENYIYLEVIPAVQSNSRTAIILILNVALFQSNIFLGCSYQLVATMRDIVSRCTYAIKENWCWFLVDYLLESCPFYDSLRRLYEQSSTGLFFCSLQSWPKIVWTTAKSGAVTDTTSNAQPI